ncbi:leucine-rich repeat domain-containing protein [Candidatus Saccharibacteria bacterium]|nr:leucine-rich repeat domain-containing protein [Candidatus Saccharibacteria bacterium]
MKNFVIAILVVAVGALGFLLYNNNNSDDSSKSDSTTANDTSKSTSGKTIDLANQGLSEVSKNILDDSKVTTLDVSNNNLTGALPAEIRKLTNLEVLDASDNKMTGIPAEIGQLSKLKTADFSNNDISGLPLEIGNLTNLVTLDLRGNPNISKYDISQIQPKIPNAQILVD